MKSIRVRISGVVQGVGYRVWVKKMARSCNLCGWVRNLSNGDVEAVFYGPDKQVSSMIENCWQGPLLARVSEVQNVEESDTVELDFVIKPNH